MVNNFLDKSKIVQYNISEVKKMIQREHYIEQVRPFYDSDLIKIITGVRRCGKSVLLFELFDEYLRNHGTDATQIIKIELDQRR